MNQESSKTNKQSLDQNSNTQQDTSQPHSDQSQNEPTSESSKNQGTGLLSTVKSIVGAMFGVQSDAQREKDFDQGNAVQFIVGGIIFVVVFIMTILYFVNSALENAGS